MENKVRFNLKNVHYALITETQNGMEFGVPVAVRGAVNLTLEPTGDMQPFYADGIIYYQTTSNNGYNGTLELARVTDKMYQDIWGSTLVDGSKVMMEHANVEPRMFALMYQIDGDADNELYCLYRCSATRPAISSQTNEDTKTPQTQSCAISATPCIVGDLEGVPMARTTAETPASVKAGWFDAVYQPSNNGAELSSLVIADAELSPAFDMGVFNYTAETDATSSAVTALAVDSEAEVVLKKGGSVVTSPVSWTTGQNVLTVEVTNGENQKIYTVVVNK